MKTLNQIATIFTQQIVSEKVVLKMAAILSLLQYGKFVMHRNQINIFNVHWNAEWFASFHIYPAHKKFKLTCSRASCIINIKLEMLYLTNEML